MNPPVLPKKPVDGYTIRWYTVYESYRRYDVEEHAAIYHINTPWRVLYPHDDRRGADFVDDWQIFDQGRFVGRNDGWDWPTRGYTEGYGGVKRTGWENAYETYEEALKAALERSEQEKQRLLQQVKECEENVADLHKLQGRPRPLMHYRDDSCKDGHGACGAKLQPLSLFYEDTRNGLWEEVQLLTCPECQKLHPIPKYVAPPEPPAKPWVEQAREAVAKMNAERAAKPAPKEPEEVAEEMVTTVFEPGAKKRKVVSVYKSKKGKIKKDEAPDPTPELDEALEKREKAEPKKYETDEEKAWRLEGEGAPVHPPVWDKNDWPNTTFGLNADQIPEPHVRRFPNQHFKRRVRIDISTWRGTCPGAQHFYVKFDEDPNPLWHGRLQKWVCPANDPEPMKGGRLFDTQITCLSLQEAQDRVKKIIGERYKDWEVEIDDELAEVTKWVAKEGD